LAKARILAVDDQLYFRVFLEDLLTQEGYAVEVAGSGEEAASRLEAERYDLIVTDLVMPGMDGIELVQRAKQRDADQDVIVVTSVEDVATVVGAMKLGANDYLLKPIERPALLRAVEGVLGQRRMREEHARLMAENLEFMGVFSLYERGAGLFSTLSLAPLADRLAEGLVLETGAQGAVVWVEEEPGRLGLAAVQGIVRIDEEPAEVLLETIPPGLADFDPDHPKVVSSADARTLTVPMTHDSRTVALARLSDPLEGDGFGDRQRLAAEKLAGFGSLAVANALRFRKLSRQSFRDPATQAYTAAYFEDAARNEIQKADRFGRSLSLVRIEQEGLAPTRAGDPAPDLLRRLTATGRRIARALRATDLLAIDSQHRFWVLLTETDSLGAAVLRRRIREALEAAPDGSREEPRPQALVASATYPTDGSQLEALQGGIEERAGEDAASPARELRRRGEPFGPALARLVRGAAPGRVELAEQAARFLLREVSRRPQERGILYLAPGAVMTAALRDGLEGLRGLSPRTEIVLVSDRSAAPGLPVTWVKPVRTGTRLAFLVYCGEGPAYVLAQQTGSPDGEPALFQSCDRPLVEHLAFSLGRDLGLSIGA
jgi:DNA-binding response OmpR family regulator/GGDEF domain-containing protein